MATPFNAALYAPSTNPLTAAPGSPTSTEITYGFGNDQFLTDKQQQISSSVQHAFDQSLAQRDRELQRYQMPQLASNVEDEALARAIATANAANRTTTNPFGVMSRGGSGGGGRGGGGGGGGGGRYYNPYGPTPRMPAGADPGSSWKSLLSGATSLAPLLFGKDAFGNFMNRGAIGWIKDQFGNTVPVDQNGQPVSDPFQQNGGMINPMTGMPMMANPYWDQSRSMDVLSPGGANGSWDVAPPQMQSPDDYGWMVGGGAPAVDTGGWGDGGGFGDWFGL